MATLSAEQKRRARQKIATRRDVAASSVTDADITAALSSGFISMSDCGGTSSSYGGDGGSGGGNYSSYDSGSSSSFDCGSSGD